MIYFNLIIPYFNPHSHAGSDINIFIKYANDCAISIHTPTQGVTRDVERLKDDFDISIHTPTQGVTCTGGFSHYELPISIHTPTQGVTNVFSTARLRSGISIHTPTQGVTRLWDRYKTHFLFQSTLPRRE